MVRTKEIEKRSKIMKKLKILFIVAIFGLLSYNVSNAKEKLGLLIIAHGSPMPQWNIPVLKLEEEVKNIMTKKKNNPFNAIRVALMEFSEPSINTVIKDFENDGINEIYAIPLFIAPSGHSLYDVPTILGLYSDKKMIESTKEERTAIVDTKMKITLGPTLNFGNILKDVMLNRVKDLSIKPDSEGVILLAHGSDPFEPIWSSLCREIGSYICAKTGIEYFDYAFVEVGQSFATKGVSTILKASKKKEKIIVIGLYLSMGVEKMANTTAYYMMGQKIETKEFFANKNIHFAKRGLLPDKRVAEWIVDRSVEWFSVLK